MGKLLSTLGLTAASIGLAAVLYQTPVFAQPPRQAKSVSYTISEAETRPDFAQMSGKNTSELKRQFDEEYPEDIFYVPKGSLANVLNPDRNYYDVSDETTSGIVLENGLLKEVQQVLGKEPRAIIATRGYRLSREDAEKVLGANLPDREKSRLEDMIKNTPEGEESYITEFHGVENRQYYTDFTKDMLRLLAYGTYFYSAVESGKTEKADLAVGDFLKLHKLLAHAYYFNSLFGKHHECDSNWVWQQLESAAYFAQKVMEMDEEYGHADQLVNALYNRVHKKEMTDAEKAEKQLKSLAFLVGLYKLNTGQLPTALVDLRVMPEGVEGWQGPYLKQFTGDATGNLFDVWFRPITYERNKANGFRLASSGPDSMINTQDDIVVSRNWEDKK